MAFSHIDKHGAANFVDISGKNHSVRQAKAFSKITMNSKAFSLLKEDRTKKGAPKGAPELKLVIS